MNEAHHIKTPNPMMLIDDPHKARAVIWRGEYIDHTAAVACDYVQGNLCIAPREYAMDFAAFCQRNPKPCPVIGRSTGLMTS